MEKIETICKETGSKNCHQCGKTLNGNHYVGPYLGEYCNIGCYTLFTED